MTLPLWTASVAKRGVWKTLRCACAWVAGLVLLTTVCYGVFSGQFWKWRAEQAKERAIAAAAEAIIEKDRREKSEAGAGVATETRHGMDRVQVDVNLPAESSARRIEADANAKPDPAAGRPDPDILRVLEEAEGRAARASNRLQRTNRR